MIRRRNDHQPLADRHQAHWLAISDMFGHVLQSEPIEAGADLYQVMAQTREQLQLQGWVLEGDGGRGSLFCHRGGERRFVCVRPTDPARTDLYGPSAHQACPSCGE